MNNNFGKNLFVETCQKVSIKPFVKNYKTSLKSIILSSEIEILNSKVTLTTTRTGKGGHRYWFICPSCSRRVGTLFNPPCHYLIGCRICLGLKYKKSRYKGMIENKLK